MKKILDIWVGVSFLVLIVGTAFMQTDLKSNPQRYLNMKSLLTLFLISLAFTSFAQVHSIDKGNGDWNDLSVGVTAVEYIENNRLTELYSLFATEYKPDSTALVKQSENIAANFGLRANSLPPTFLSTDSSGLWYERTYYQRVNLEVVYVLQLFIQLEVRDEQVVVTQIEFREGESIERRDDELSLLGKVDENNPPPPPPPPMIGN